MESTVKSIVLGSLGGLKSSRNYGFQFVKLKIYGCGVNVKTIRSDIRQVMLVSANSLIEKYKELNDCIGILCRKIF